MSADRMFFLLKDSTYTGNLLLPLNLSVYCNIWLYIMYVAMSIVHNWSIYSFDSLSNLSSGQVYLMIYSYDSVNYALNLLIYFVFCGCLNLWVQWLMMSTESVFCLLIIHPMNLFYYEFEIKSVHCVFIIFWITVALLLLSFHSGF